MVDFQERDESRGLGTGDEDDEDGDHDPERIESESVSEAAGKTAENGEQQESSDATEGDNAQNQSSQHQPDHHQHDSHPEHDHHRHDVDQIGAAIVTISTTRTLDSDPAGDAIEAVIDSTGEVVTRELIPDDFDTIQGTVNQLADRQNVDVIVTAGGTGVTPDDVTIEAIRPLFSKDLPGFGELFRILSHDDVGTKVVATRAAAGIVDGVPVFCMPGSENAVRLGTEQIIVPEAGHLSGLASRETEEKRDETDQD